MYHHTSPNNTKYHHVSKPANITTYLWPYLLQYHIVKSACAPSGSHVMKGVCGISREWGPLRWTKDLALTAMTVLKSISGVMHIHSNGVEWKSRVHTWSCCHITSYHICIYVPYIYIYYHILSYRMVSYHIKVYHVKSQQTNQIRSNCKCNQIYIPTVDGWNPAPPGMYKTL